MNPLVNIVIEEITAADNDAVCQIIKTVGAEFGAVGEGFGPSDDEVLCMSEHYSAADGSVYLVARLEGELIEGELVEGELVGGCGIAPFNGSNATCELKKLFLLPQSRGHGVGQALTQRCLDFAAAQGYRQCYLDTLSNMTSAIALYEKLGFSHLEAPLAGTEHNGCDIWMIKALAA